MEEDYDSEKQTEELGICLHCGRFGKLSKVFDFGKYNTNTLRKLQIFLKKSGHKVSPLLVGYSVGYDEGCRIEIYLGFEKSLEDRQQRLV